MHLISWIIVAIAAVALAVALALVLVPAVRRRRTYVATVPVTISVTEPVEDVLESPQHAADARAAERRAPAVPEGLVPGDVSAD